ncbi:MAG: hypothetical protein ACNA7G_06275 [Methylobacter sp.]
MKIDFKNAAERHYRDGELLYRHSYWANADQLYGLSSECILKRIIVGLDSNSVNQVTGDFTDRNHRKHFDNKNNSKDLWSYFSITFAGRLAQHSLPSVNRFSDWDIFQRYIHESYIDQHRADSHRLATKALQNLLQELFIDGVIQ